MHNEEFSSENPAALPLRLESIRFLAKGINLFEFRRPDGSDLPAASPGAHIDLHLPNGMVRQYSLVTAGARLRAYMVAIKRDEASRGGSSYIHERLRVGHVLQIGPPRNNFPLDADAAHTVLFAGGIGITPIWCMVQHLRAEGRSFEVHFACRDRTEAAFRDELQSLPEVHVHFDTENGGKFLDIAAIVAKAPDGAHFYCCGPSPMLAAFEAATKHLAAERVHVEYFTAEKKAAVSRSFTVELHGTGRRFEIPAGQTILQVLRNAGIDAPYSCEEGICGACQVTVVSGTPDHRDSVLTEKERQSGKMMLICCSGSQSDHLVIDF